MTDANILQQEIAIEQRHVDIVYARLAELRDQAAKAEKAGYGLARVGNFGALVERDAMVFHAARRRRTLDSEHEGLVFGRLDLNTGQLYYVGRLGIRGEGSESLVVDWRAPAAAAFYQATAKDTRDVVRRRMIRSTGERVTGVEDDLLDPEAAPADMHIVGDGALMASLGRATGAGMKDIVATIQQEQDEAIRAPAAGVTIVSGGPGTGKTAVALHRAAYLLYSDRSRFAGGGILVVGPSGVFVNYIATVLPALGEDSATLHSLGSLIPGLNAVRVDPAAVAAVKGSLRMRKVLERASHDAVPFGPTELRLLYRGTLLRLTTEDLNRARERALPRGARRNEARRSGFDNIFQALWTQAQRQRVSTLPLRPEFEAELSERDDFRDFLRSWWPQLRPSTVLAWLADPERLRKYAHGILSNNEIKLLRDAFSTLAADGPTIADVALLDELDSLLGQPRKPQQRNRNTFHAGGGVQEVTTFADRQAASRVTERPEDYRDYAHVMVDEAQDVSPMQWRMLGRRASIASWTIVGDPLQAAWTGNPAELSQARDQALGGKKRHEFTLSTNYRNSREIFEVAASVIRRAFPGEALPTAVRSTGVSPIERTVRVDELADTVRESAAELLKQVEGTVGVITPVPRRAEIAAWVASLSDERVQVVTSLQAKGMEYDGVVLVEPEEIRTDSESGVRTLYVALSRATQQLITVGTRPYR
ncbi:HelD family protein [Catenuloplanes sp. NPDC051500]|uniref:HelD family protein n=1 Tax=Catenuloplanes sp. NPDC051500 TaxID=3363959 RepID=UPI0037ADB119